MEGEKKPLIERTNSQIIAIARDHGVSPEMVKRILLEIVDLYYFDSIKQLLASQSRWRIACDVLELIGRVGMGTTVILSAGAGVFDSKWTSFAATAVGAASLTLMKLSSYAAKESSERAEQAKKLMDHIGMRAPPDIAVDSSTI
jgi:hypothetical protein